MLDNLPVLELDPITPPTTTPVQPSRTVGLPVLELDPITPPRPPVPAGADIVTEPLTGRVIPPAPMLPVPSPVPSTTLTIPEPEPYQPETVTEPLSGVIMPQRPMADTAPAPLADTGSGFFSGALVGTRDMMRETARLMQGQAFTPDPNAPPQPEHREFWNELGYGLGRSPGVVAAGLGGGALGLAAGGPPGAILGAGLGVGGSSGLQDLVPAYQSAISRGMPHEKAVDYALIHATATGGISGATAYLWGPFKGAIGKILYQTLFVAPVGGTAVRTGVPAIMGEPQPSAGELGRGAVQDVMGAVGFTGAHLAGRAAVEAGRPPPPVPATSPVDLQARGEYAPPPVGASETATERFGTPSPEPPSLGSIFTVPAEPTPPRELVLGQQPVTAAPAQTAEPYAQTLVPPAVPRIVAGGPDERLAGTAGRPGESAPVGETGAPRVEPAGVPGLPRTGGDIGESPATRPGAPIGEQQAARAPTSEPLRPLETEPAVVQPQTEPAAVAVVHSRDDYRAVVGGTYSLSSEDKASLATSIERAVAEKGAVTFEDLPKEITGKLGMDQLENIKARLDNPGLILDVLRGDTSRVAPSKGAEAAAAPATPAVVQPQTEPAAAPAKRPVTQNELTALDKRVQQAAAALRRAVTPDEITKAEDRLQTARTERDNAEGPPSRPSYQRTPEGARERHEANVAAHSAAIDERIYREGQDPVPDTKPAALRKIFTIGETSSIVRGTDSAGNAWTGTGNVLLRGHAGMERSATQEAKNRRSTERAVATVGLDKVVVPDTNTTYEGVTWRRQVTDAGGTTMVLGTKPDGTIVALQKPIYDALHAAAGADGSIVADVRSGKPSDNRMFAHNQAGEVVGVGMPIRVDEAQAKIWASGRQTEVPVETGRQTEVPVETGRQTEVPVETGPRTTGPERAPVTEVEDAIRARPSERITDDEALARSKEDAVEAPPARDDGITTEPDHLDPARSVAKNEDGEVVGKGATQEEARADAVARERAPYEDEAPKVPQDKTLELLTNTRDALADKPRRTPAEERKLGQISQQIARRERALDAEDKAGPRRGGRKQPFEGPPQVGRERDLLDYKFNDGTSVFRSIFEEAGHDPDLAVHFPIHRQTEILSQHAKLKFGFTDVQVAGYRGRAATPVEHKLARDALLDMTRALVDFTASLGLPHTSASLDGTLRLVIDPAGKVNYYGMYQSDGTLRVAGGANSYGHEWTHALDHLMAERFTGDPLQMNKLLSQYARDTGLDTRDNVQAAFAKLINTMFYDDVALATRRLALEVTAAKVDKAGNPTKAALDAQAQLARMEGGGSKLRILSSEFRRESAAFHPPKAAYYASVYEMLARAHEAYIARRMTQNGVDPRGVVMPDEAYINMVDRQLRMAYPKQPERTAIDAAFDELHHAMRREQVLGEGKPAGDFSDYGISDPFNYKNTAPNAGKTTLGQRIKAEINSYRNFTKTLTERAGLFDKTRPKAPQPASTRAANHARAMYKAVRGMMNIIIARAPDDAKKILQPIMDSLATAPGKGRFTPENFEERVITQTRQLNYQYGNILEKHGFHEYNPMTTEERQMLRHILVTGDRRMPLDPLDPTLGTTMIPQNIVKLSGDVRHLLDKTWKMSHDAGLEIGYAKNGFFPRHYDRHRAHSDAAGFQEAAHKLYSKMFNDEVGAPGTKPETLLEKWTELSRESKELAKAAAGSNIDLPGRMQELNENLRRQREIEENPTPTPAETAELAKLKGEAQTLTADVHSLLRDYVAQVNAAEWHANLTGGGIPDFDSAAPTGKYLKTRVLPPEADIIMRDYMQQDPEVVLPAYFHSVARRIAYAERFGVNGERLKEATQKLARIPGMDGLDTTKFMTLVADITGRQQNGGMSIFTQIPHNMAFAAGSMVLMERAMWASLSEPMTASMVTGDHRAGLMSIANSLGQLIGTASARDRTALAEFLGVITSPMHDSTMNSRMGADYSDSPRMEKFLRNYYRTTFLTQVTNGQRAGTTGSSNWFIHKLSQHLLNTETSVEAGHARDNAERWFRELGLPDSIHKDFAKWMVDMEGKLPTPDLLIANPGMGDAYGLAVRRLVDRIIQDPKKIDRALLANVPIIGLAYQLMSFNGSFTENVIYPAARRVQYQYLRGRGEAEARGAGRLSANAQAAFGTTGTVVNTAAIAASMIAASTMTGIVRTLIYAPDQWKEHEEKGDLLPYLLRMGASRSGLYGRWDPLQQIVNHVKYDSDLASLVHGAAINWYLKNLTDVIMPMLGQNSPNTNTAEYNQARAIFNLTAVPLAAFGLTALGTLGPVSRLGAGIALQLGTSPGASNLAARTWAGPKGATLPTTGTGDGLPKLSGLGGMRGLPKMGEGGRALPASGSGFGGLVGDVAIPAVGYVFPQLGTPLKLGLAGAAGAYGVYRQNKEVAPFRNLPAPKPPRQPARQ